MNLTMTARQEREYDKTVAKIREYFGSYNSIALRVHYNCEKEHTGEGFRAWFHERRLPTHLAFSIYEIMEGGIDPLTLCPWMTKHVELIRHQFPKKKKAASKSG